MQSTGCAARWSRPARADHTGVMAKPTAGCWSARAINRAVSTSSSISRTDAAMHMLLPEVDDELAQRPDAGGFGAKDGGPGRLRGGRLALPTRLTEHEDGDAAELRVCREFAQDRRRVHVGETEVEHDERRAGSVGERWLALEERQRVPSGLDGM